MSKQINVAIVGCGGMAQHYLSVYRDLPWVHVCACVDISMETADRAKQFINGDLASSEFAAALAPCVDAVIINTPNHFHREQAIAAMKAGKHILLQKPIASNVADAEAIAEVAERTDVISGLYMSYFDQPLMHDIRDLLARGAIGEPVHFYARLMHKGGLLSSAQAIGGNRTWRTSLKETGGGCFIQLAVHYIHLFEWAGGHHVTTATALTANLHSPGVEGEDLACAVLQCDSGAMITLDMAWCTNGEELAIHGTLGRLEYRNSRWFAMTSSQGAYRGRVIDYACELESSFDGIHGVERQMEIRPPSFGDAGNPFNQQRMFLEAVRDGKPAFCSISSGVRDLRVVRAVYDAARNGRAVECG